MNNELFDQAVKMWFRYCHQFEMIPDQPSEADSTIEGAVVTLRNTHGVLATYDCRKQRNRLTFAQNQNQRR